jgi:hypothetical protein
MVQLIDPFSPENNSQYKVGDLVQIRTFNLDGFLPTGWCDPMVQTMGCLGQVKEASYNSYSKNHYYVVDVTLDDGSTVNWKYTEDQVQTPCN